MSYDLQPCIVDVVTGGFCKFLLDVTFAIIFAVTLYQCPQVWSLHQGSLVASGTTYMMGPSAPMDGMMGAWTDLSGYIWVIWMLYQDSNIVWNARCYKKRCICWVGFLTVF